MKHKKKKKGWRSIGAMVIDITIAAIILMFIAFTVSQYLEFKFHPEINMLSSAPWYTGVMVFGVFVLLCLGLLLILRYTVFLEDRAGKGERNDGGPES